MSKQEEQPKKQNLLFSVISNKGGVGKTSLSTALSFYLANELGKTLLIELDSSPGDLEMLFDLRADRSIEVAIKFPESYEQNLKKIFCDLYVLKGFKNPMIAENIKPDDKEILLNNVKQDFQFIVVDTQTVINGIILDFLKLSDFVFIISDFSIESLFRISQLLRMLIDKFSLDSKIFHILINKKRLMDNFKLWDISKIIDFPIEGFINYDRNFNKSNFLINRRKIFKSKFYNQAKRIFKEVVCN